MISVKEGLREDITGAKITVSSVADQAVRVVLSVNSDRELVAEYGFENSVGSGKTVGSKTTLAAKSAKEGRKDGDYSLV